MSAAMQQFPPQRDYSSLSIADLLDARDAWHVHLTHLQNVVATAIGKYRILKSDWYYAHAPQQPAPAGRRHGSEPRTLGNSGLRPWSWPCVLVFVREWVARDAFAQSPDQMVPRALFLPDGRIVPTCVVLAQEDDDRAPAVEPLGVAANLIYGGAQVLGTSQGQTRVGSIGCLVSDGRIVYALTNEHVAGAAGTESFTYVRGQRERIGVSAPINRRKVPFESVYPGWAGSNAVANLDAGLIVIDDIDAWTPSILDLGPLGEPADLTQDAITFNLLEAPVRAYGAASGLLLGQIEALFYRYKTAGGVDYITDFLIGPRTEGVDRLPPDDRRALATRTRPGDSGTLWSLEFDGVHGAKSYRPIALQWGGHVFVENGVRRNVQSFALAASLTTICREFDVDVLRDWERRLPEYWGDVGHYTIAAKACALVQIPQLRTLLQNNLQRISYNDDEIDPKTFKGLSNAAFVPLADVPDKVWKRPGAGARGGPEHPNHFADMDKPRPSDGKTLLDLTATAGGDGTDPSTVTPGVFRAYYDSVRDQSRGLLPFRVQELFDIMARTQYEPEFVCAAGVLAHYVGDACQPLHISYLFDGIPSNDVSASQGKGVHTAYETKMLNSHAADILANVNATLGIGGDALPKGGMPLVSDGHGAAVATVQLMRETFAILPPREIVEAYIAEPDVAHLYDLFGARTVDVIANGCRTLAMIYDSAWKANPWQLGLGEVAVADLTALYLDKRWAPSETLDQFAAEGGNAASP